MNPLTYIEEPLRWTLDFLHDQLNLTYGWSIVVLTVIVRTLLLPLVIKQYKSMREMQLYAPQIKELQRKYKGNRQKLNEEMMKFYRENQVNPFASCLPLVFQLPVFFALYYVLRSYSREGQLDGTDPSFMWVIPNISERIQDIGWGAVIVLGVYGLSQLISTELSATPQMPDVQRRLFRVLPIVIISSFFLFDQFYIPAGLVLYWATTNLWTAGQQLVMRHKIGLHLAQPEVAAQASGKRSSRTPPKERDAEAGDVVVEGDAEPQDAPEPETAPEPEEAPEPELAEADAEEPGEDEGQPEPEAPAEPEPARSGASRSRGQQGKRRQPRPKGGGSRGGRKQPRRRR